MLIFGYFFFSSRRRHTRCALVTGVQTCALPILTAAIYDPLDHDALLNELGQPVGTPVPGWTPRQAPPRESMEGRLCRVEPLDPARHAENLFAAYSADK